MHNFFKKLFISTYPIALNYSRVQAFAFLLPAKVQKYILAKFVHVNISCCLNNVLMGNTAVYIHRR